MAPYFLILVVSTVLAKLSGVLDSVSKMPLRVFRFNFFDIFLAGALVTFSAFRLDVGTDFSTYFRLYSVVDPEDWRSSILDSPQEFGYSILSLITKSIVIDPYAIFWSSAALTISMFFLRLKKIEGSFALAIFLYIVLAYYVFPFNLVRQGIAVSIVFFAESYFRKNKVLFFVLVAIASTFHTSAIFFVVGYLIALKIRPTLKLVASISLGALLIAGTFLAFPQFGAFLSIFNDRYESALTYGGAGLGTFLALAFKAVVIGYVFVLRSQGCKVNELYFVLVIFSMAFTIVGFEVKLATRLGEYFGVFMIPLLVEAISSSRNKMLHYYVIVIVGVAYFTAYLSNYGGLIPYRIQTF